MHTSLSRLVLSGALVVVLLFAMPTGVGAVSLRETDLVGVSTGSFNDWVNSIAVDETDSKRVYASTTYLSDPPGALYRSDDRGAHWASIYATAPSSLRMGQAALKTVGPYVLAGSALGSAKGIFRASQAGTSWTALTTWSGDERVRAIETNPDVASHIFAVTEQGTATSPNLRYSLNSGGSWTTRAISIPATETRAASSVAVLESGALIVGCENVRWVSGPNGGGVYLSDDLGSSWERTGCRDMDVTDVSADPAHPTWVWACAQTAEGARGLDLSTNGGAGFNPVALPANAAPSTVDVDSLGRIFVGSRGGTGGEVGTVFQSDDSGTSWSMIATQLNGAGVHTADLDAGGCTLYTGGQGGVSRYWVPSAEEIAGADRYRTAIDINKTCFPAPDSANALVIASGLNFPDAVVAGPFATLVEGGILLAGASGLDSATMTEIDRSLPAASDVYIVGGTAAVPASVDGLLSARGYRVIRLAGADRYATSAVVAARFTAPTSCFVANGAAFPDALSASAPAADLGMPILLVRQDLIPQSVNAYLTANDASLTSGYIAGDTTVVGATVASQLAVSAEAVTRLGGHTRYDTSLAIAQRFHPVPAAAAGVATGINYPDGLAGSVLCAQRGGPLVLIAPDTVPSATGAYLKSGEPDTLTVFGGRAAIGLDARCQLEALW